MKTLKFKLTSQQSQHFKTEHNKMTCVHREDSRLACPVWSVITVNLKNIWVFS